MERETIENAMKEAVHEYYSCYDYQCEGRDCCEFCNGQHSASYSKESCKADDFGEGFYYGAEWRINSVWHTDLKEAQTQRNLLVAFTSGRVGMFDDIRLLKGIEDLIARYAYVDELLPSK